MLGHPIFLMGGKRVDLTQSGFDLIKPVGDGFREPLADQRKAGSTWLSQSGGLRISRGFDPSAGPTIPSRSIMSIRGAARPYPIRTPRRRQEGGAMLESH